MLWDIHYKNGEFARSIGDPLLGRVEADTKEDAENKASHLDWRCAGVLAVPSKARVVEIPACEEHEGIHSTKVALVWSCPTCHGPRGEPFKTISYDGSLRLGVDGWTNPCGHVDKYPAVLREAMAEIDSLKK